MGGVQRGKADDVPQAQRSAEAGAVQHGQAAGRRGTAAGSVAVQRAAGAGDQAADDAPVQRIAVGLAEPGDGARRVKQADGEHVVNHWGELADVLDMVVAARLVGHEQVLPGHDLLLQPQKRRGVQAGLTRQNAIPGHDGEQGPQQHVAGRLGPKRWGGPRQTEPQGQLQHEQCVQRKQVLMNGVFRAVAKPERQHLQQAQPGCSQAVQRKVLECQSAAAALPCMLGGAPPPVPQQSRRAGKQQQGIQQKLVDAGHEACNNMTVGPADVAHHGEGGVTGQREAGEYHQQHVDGHGWPGARAAVPGQAQQLQANQP